MPVVGSLKVITFPTMLSTRTRLPLPSSKPKLGTWEDASADATGTAAHFRLYASDGTTCHMQGTVTVTGGGGDMTLDNVSITSGQTITITSFTLTAGNA